MTKSGSRFLRKYAASAVGNTPVQPNLPPDDDSSSDEQENKIDRSIEVVEDEWIALPTGTTSARAEETPQRFIDGSQSGQPVLCVRSPQGYPIPLYLSEVGAVALRSEGRGFVREFVAMDRVLSLVADVFDWADVEEFAEDIVSKPELRLRLLPANRPTEEHNPFDYELMRSQARNRAQQEMTSFERLALSMDRSVPTLVDGPISRVTAKPKPGENLLIGVAKSQSANYLHPKGWSVLMSLQTGERTPVFKLDGVGADRVTIQPVATWFLKLTGSSQLAPNWGYVRVEVPWIQFQDRTQNGNFGFVDRLSRWLIQAKCTSQSYARMPVSLDPIVRAEDALKPLFTPTVVLVNRLYRTAGLFRGGEL